MTRIVIGPAISAMLFATVACSGSSPSSPSASPSASPSTTAFSAQTFSAGSAGTTLSTFDHGHDGHDVDHDNGRETQIEGIVASIDAAHTSFVVNGTTVKVLPTTVIRHGDVMLKFADLKAGDRVHVKGTPNGTAVDAREVKVQNDGEDGHDRDNDHEVEGVVAGLAGTCPSVTFTVGAAKTKVTANDKTLFGHSGCAAVVNGAHVEVEGTVQADGSILATHVSVQHEGDDDGD